MNDNIRIIVVKDNKEIVNVSLALIVKNYLYDTKIKPPYTIKSSNGSYLMIQKV